MVRVVAGQTTSVDAVMRRAATLTGAVRDSAGTALPGVIVTARLDGSAQGPLTTTTGADGAWRFAGLDVTADRLYALSFTDPAGAYLPLDYDADPLTPGVVDLVSVAAEQTTTADAVLRRSCTLGGVVTDSRTGKPVAGMPVEVATAPARQAAAGRAAAGRAMAAVLPTAVTDAAGAYTLTGIPDGAYVLVCKGVPPLYGVQYWPAAQTAEAATPFTLTPAAPSAVADVVLHHDDTRPVTTALNAVKMRTRNTATLKYRVTDAYGDKAALTLIVATRTGRVKARVKLGVRAVNVSASVKWKPGKLAPGKYSWWIVATDLAGNTQSRAVKKSLTLTR